MAHTRPAHAIEQAALLVALMFSPLAVHALTMSDTAALPVAATVTSLPVAVSADASASASASSSAADAAAAVLTSLAGGTAATSTADATATPPAIGTAVNVTTDADLAAFTAQVAATNRNVVSIDTGSTDTISVTYAHQAKLFGVIPVTIDSRTTVVRNSDGSPTVTTTFPWWRVFASGTGSTADMVDSAVEASAVAQTYAAADSANAKAQVTENIVATLNASAGVPIIGNY